MSTCQKSATYSKDEIFGNDDSDYSMCDLYGVTWLPGGGVTGVLQKILYRKALEPPCIKL